jgi:hypothetical protein
VKTRTLALGELQDLQEVAVRVAEVEGLDAAGVGVPVGERLRAARGVPDAVLPQPGVGPVHVARDDGDVLEGVVVGPDVSRYRPSRWGEVLGELDLLCPQAHPHDPHPGAENTYEPLVCLTPHLDVGHRLEVEDVLEEGRRPIRVRHREASNRGKGDAV